MITLTHVCRAWRDIFISRSSLWTDLDCQDTDKTRAYLERSKSLPIDVWFKSDQSIPPHGPFPQFTPHAIGRLGSLSIIGVGEHLPSVTAHLSHPAPLLRKLVIDADCTVRLARYPVLTPALFGGDLSSLRDMQLWCVRTELQWRNMANLTTFILGQASPGGMSIGQLIDFFGGAPRLRRIELFNATPTSDVQGQQLVSLGSLKKMDILDSAPCSLLLNHLLIPTGAKLKTQVNLIDIRLEDYLPGSLNNLRNLSGFTDIDLYFGQTYWGMRFTGPNGQVSVFPATPNINSTWALLDQFVKLYTPNIERLRIVRGNLNAVYWALLPLKDLHTLTLSRCRNLYAVTHALSPNSNSSGVVVCPKLEELVLDPLGNEALNILDIIRMAAARMSRGAKLKSVRTVSQDTFMQMKASGLEEYVSHMECISGVGATSDDSDSSDGED